MNSFKKFTAALAALAVSMTSVLTFSVAVAATTFTDASSIASWASASVTSLSTSGVLSGRPDGSFDPQGQLNRAEVAKVAVKAAGLTEDTTGAPHFNDVSASNWFYTFVETLYNNGVVGGVNGGALDSNGLATYNPGGTLNRAEGAKILVDAFELETAYAGTPPNFPDAASSAWFYDYVETAYAHGIINGYSNGNFGPSNPITREQIAVIAKSGVDESASASKRRSSYTAGAASGVASTPSTPAASASDGDLSVALSASTPAAKTFPQGAASTSVAAYDFTASSDDVTITNLVVKRAGVGADSDWTLYLYDGNDRLSSGKTVNSTSHEATFTGINVTVAAGTTKTLTLKADTATLATGGDSYFEISASSSVASNAKSVRGSFPMKSTKQEINTSVSAGTITVEKIGSITNPEVGSTNVTVAKFKLTTANEAGSVKQVAVVVDGTISATDIQNAALYQGSTKLATVSAVNAKDLLVFSLATPYEIEKGDSRNFEIKADFNTGRSNDTVKVYLDEATDVVATGGTYGFGMAVTYSSFDGAGTSGTCSTSAQTIDDASCSVLQGGDITISSSGPSATDIAVNADDVVLLNFSLTSVSEATFKKFGISLTTNDTAVASDAGGLLSGTTSNYTDIKIINKDTGSVLMGPIDSSAMGNATGVTTAISATETDATGDTDGFYIFQDEFVLAAGEELNLSITVDIANNTDSDFTDDTILASIDISSSTLEIKDINNKTVTNSSSVVPSTDITGKTMTIKSPSLTIALASTPVSNTVVKGTQDVCFVGFSLSAGDASDIKISELKVDGGSDADGSSWTQAAAGADDIVGSVELYEGTTKIGTSEGVQSDGTATFDNLSYTIDAGATKLLKVCGDVSSNIASGNRGIAFAVAAAANITAEDEDGNSVTPTGTASLVATTPSVIMTVSQGGSLTVAVDADTPKENIVVAGTSDVTISKFKFITTDESFLVRKVSINNRQSAANSVGDYDNNVTEIKISYTNSAGATETKSGYLTGGAANFSGMDMLVDKDDDSVLTISATLNTVAAGATAGEFVDLNLAFNDFEAVAQGSGETYTGSKLDSAVAVASDLDIGTITIVDAGVDVASGAQAVVVGSSATITVPDLGDEELPVGTLVAFTAAAATYVEATDTLIALTTAYSGAATDLTMTGYVVNAGAGDVDALDINYALPGTGYLTNANQMVVYESRPTIALASSSPSGSRTTSASDNVFVFTLSADAQEKIQIRAALQNTADTATTDEVTAGAAMGVPSLDTTNKVEGTGSAAYTFSADASTASTGPMFDAGATALISSTLYPRVSLWFGQDAVAATSAATEAQIEFVCGVTAVNTRAQAVGTGATDLIDGTALVWYYYDIANPCTAADQFYGVGVVAASTFATGDKIFVDDVRFYNEKVVVDLASDTSFAATTATNGLVAYLKEGGSTVATGYVVAASTSAASVTFIPTTAIEISKGTSKTFTVSTATNTLITDQAGTDDLLTVSIALGSSTAGTVTAGGVWWNETNATVKWMGQVSDTTLNGNTLKY